MFEAPDTINWNYTYACNFNCAHCYSRAPEYPKELSIEGYDQLTEAIIAAQVFRVAFGGGEPLIKRHFIRTLGKLGRRGIETYFTTNGWSVTEGKAVELAEAGVSKVAVSIDSSERASHDALRNKVGSFDRALSAIKHLSGRIPCVIVSCTVHKQNVSEVPRLVEMCLNGGADEINLKIFRAAGNGLVLSDQLELCAADLHRHGNDVAKLRARYGRAISQYGPESAEGCSCGMTTLTLRPNGDLAVCAYGDVVLGNLLHDDLTDIWLNHPTLRARRRNPVCLGQSRASWPLSPSVGADRSADYSLRLRSRWEEQSDARIEASSV